MAVLDPEELVTLKPLARLGVSNVEIAGTLGVTEGTVRYHRRRLASGARDGRANKPFLAESFREAVDAYLEARQEDAPSNVQDLHDFLVAEQAYPGSLSRDTQVRIFATLGDAAGVGSLVRVAVA